MRLLWVLCCLSCAFLHAEPLPQRAKYFLALKKPDHTPWKNLENCVSVLPPESRFYADPMLFKHNGINYIFFENYDYRKGIIEFVTVDEHLQVSHPELALELNVHLSFPFVFEEKGAIYMIPESYKLGEIALYEARNFPYQWEKKKVLLSGQDYGDSILFQHGGYYWIFTCVQGELLRIFYADDLFSEFHPHPINQQNHLGRNAGRAFTIDNRLIRPVMDCRKTYGGAMTLNEIKVLTPTHFEEEVIDRIEPDWAPDLNGTHTFNFNEDLVVYDGKRIISSTEEDKEYSK